MPSVEGFGARRAALQMLDAVLRRGQTLDAAAAAVRNLSPPDRALAVAIAGEVLRRMPDLDALIDSATRQRLPDDSKARMVLRLALAQKIGLGTPDHALVATALPLVDGGPRRLVHGVLGTLLRRGVPAMDAPKLPAEVEERWSGAWGEEAVQPRGGRSQSGRRWTSPSPTTPKRRLMPKRHGGISLAPNHVRLESSSVADLPGFAEGRWWVQDLAASLPARLIPPEAKDVLDLCAAPGGKTMQLAAAGHQVTAVDSSRKSSRTTSRESRADASHGRADRSRCSHVESRPEVRRDPPRRPLLGDGHVSPPSRSPLPRPPEGHRARAPSFKASSSTAPRLAEAGRSARLFRLLARAAGGRGGHSCLPAATCRISSIEPPNGLPDLRAISAEAGCASSPACSKPKAGSTASSWRALSAPLNPV